jgi:hypothetical protein
MSFSIGGVPYTLYGYEVYRYNNEYLTIHYNYNSIYAYDDDSGTVNIVIILSKRYGGTVTFTTNGMIPQ